MRVIQYFNKVCFKKSNSSSRTFFRLSDKGYHKPHGLKYLHIRIQQVTDRVHQFSSAKYVIGAILILIPLCTCVHYHQREVYTQLYTDALLSIYKKNIIISATQHDENQPSDSEVFKTSELNVLLRHTHYDGHIVTLQLHSRTQTQVHTRASTCARVAFRHPPPRLAAEPAQASNRISNFNLESLTQCL